MTSASFSKYKLIAELGHGGMADVFLAVQAGPAGSGFSKLTVIKRLRANLADEPEFVAMLVDEARIAARLNHPNVVQTNEVGEVDNQYYIAMEYLDGQPFHRLQHRATQRAKDGKPPILTKSMQYVVLMDALAGLHHAHELADYDGSPLNIVHRDMTPHNIFVTYEGQVKVVDFGIAKAAGRSSETRQGIVKGKVRYMAPEQAIGQDVDRRADIFAAGIMLWEMATARRVWKDKDDLRIVQELVVGDVPTSPRKVDPTVPEAIDKMCRRALAVRREERYATAEEFRLDLEQHLADSGDLVDARRKLPAVTAELFKDKRAEIRSVIEKQLAMLSNMRSTPSGFRTAVVAADPPSSTSNPSNPSALSSGFGATGELAKISSSSPDLSGGSPVPPASSSVPAGEMPTLVAAEPVSSARGARPGRRTRTVLGVAVVGIACAGAFVAWRSASRANAAVASPNTMTTVSAASASATPSDEIFVRFTGSPKGAVVHIDDGPAQVLPFETKMHRDDRGHHLSFDADGFVSRTEDVNFVRDLSITVDLVPKPVSANSRAKAAPAAWPPVAAPTRAAAAVAGAKATEPGAPVEAPTQPAASAKPPADKRGTGRLVVDPNMPW